MAQELGADAVMITPAREPVPSDDRIVEMYEQIAHGLAIPIVLQDHPASSEVHMPVALMLRLLRSVPAIQCVKEEAVPTAAEDPPAARGTGRHARADPDRAGSAVRAFRSRGGLRWLQYRLCIPRSAHGHGGRGSRWRLAGCARSVFTLCGPDCLRATARRGDPEGAAASSGPDHLFSRAPSGRHDHAGGRQAARHGAGAHAARRGPDATAGAGLFIRSTNHE